MTIPYTPPSYKSKAFNCPLCGAYADQIWFNAMYQDTGRNLFTNYIFLVYCRHCQKFSIWIDEKMVYPTSGNAPLPNPDMPEDIRNDFIEARYIVSMSPRGATALLRLAIQKLCKHLGEKGKDLNEDIGNLVQKGLPVKLQKALDNVRVIGNNAVHPGQLDLTDDIDTANQLFVFVNLICDSLISQPKQIDEFYLEKIPVTAKEAIDKRDGIDTTNNSTITSTSV
ncbi:MAG: DUF4145 domain-containing protein [Ignavibacteriae bacterium]|nr:DUF4145 domain-containing protein [Ignavibacteriota bacterium]